MPSNSMPCAVPWPSTWSGTSVAEARRDERGAGGDSHAPGGAGSHRRAHRARADRGGVEGGTVGAERREPASPPVRRRAGSRDDQAAPDGLAGHVPAAAGRHPDLHRRGARPLLRHGADRPGPLRRRRHRGPDHAAGGPLAGPWRRPRHIVQPRRRRRSAQSPRRMESGDVRLPGHGCRPAARGHPPPHVRDVAEPDSLGAVSVEPEDDPGSAAALRELTAPSVRGMIRLAFDRLGPGGREMRKLVLESTQPFQGLPELVAYDEGLFEKEGLSVEWVDREAGGIERKTERDVTSPARVDPFSSHGRLFERGGADMYNACEWGNYCRVQETGVKSRQLGRRAIVAYGALVVPADSPVYTPQQLAHRTVGLPFYFGTHYLGLHLLSGFLPREAIRVCRAPAGSRYRLASLLKGEIEATTVTEPYVALAEKKGCRTVAAAFFHGTEVGSERVDAEMYAAFNRAVREAVRRINANKRAYLRYFIDGHRDDPEIAALTVDDLRESRIVVCDPAPIPLDEMQRTFDWLKSWGMLEATVSPVDLVNLDLQTHAHPVA